jgi:biopolymer transport protein ExbB
MRIKVLTFVFVVWVGVVWTAAYAQQGGNATEALAATDSGTSLWGTIKQGGPLMLPLGLLSVATIALGVYGFLMVRESKMLTPELLGPIDRAISSLQVEEAMKICQGTPSLLTNIMYAGLDRVHDGYLDLESMEKAMEEASVEETAAGLKMISYLSIVAQLAPMVGLLGTVSGMIKAFAKIGKGAMGRPEVLAGNIGEALVTTAAGLIIGIPAMFLYFHLKGRYTANVTKLGRMLGNLSHHLVAASRGQGEQAQVPGATA